MRMASDSRLKPTEGHRTRPRPRSRAAAHWARTGAVLPGTAGEVAAYRARVTEYHREQEQEGQGRE